MASHGFCFGSHWRTSVMTKKTMMTEVMRKIMKMITIILSTEMTGEMHKRKSQVETLMLTTQPFEF